MALSNYTNIKAAVEKWLNREDFATITGSTEDFMTLAQRNFMRVVRIPSMEKVVTLTTASSELSVPTDYLEMKHMLVLTSTPQDMSRSDYNTVRRKASCSGVPREYARSGSSFKLAPVPDTSYDFELVYYADIPYISSTNEVNWFSTYAPELILYSTLVEAYLFMKEEDKAAVWQQKFDGAMLALAEQKNSAEYSGAGLSIKPSNGVTP